MIVSCFNYQKIVFSEFKDSLIVNIFWDNDSNLRKAGNSPTVIMKASGHKKMSMFLRYNLVDEEDLKGIRWIERKTESDTKDISAKISA